MKGMPRAGILLSHCLIGTAVTICDGATVRSCDGLIYARTLANTTRSQRNNRRCDVKKIESRAVDRGFGLQKGCVVKVFSCGEADEGRFWVGLDTRVGSA